ncbi:hypothetical protein [Candidatus Nitrosocosmicus arcticus]|uniref:Uncharacterized protein n=1 Tax=Candidatus Nitrosocosmicus arcticus TaxID=2035267 RepID=A0A557SRY2_9ARCH|nr:hypothetical protein [Candidatus Nitrosocosmicus arcticus]TVP39370.1 hypothetical protein NARC_160084 [Candidatus Nitrosocosmicus arcticus]
MNTIYHIHGRKNSIRTKIPVLREWLGGVSRDNIAINNKIAKGFVSNIIQEFKNKEIPDIDLLREVAIALKNQDMDLIQFSRSMRLKNMLDGLEVSEEQIENFLEDLSVFFYKDDIRDTEKFLSQLESVSDMAESLDLSIYGIQAYVEEKKAELGTLDKELSAIKKQVEQKKSEFINTVKNIEKYREARRYGE